MEAVGLVGGLVVETHADGAWGAISELINELSSLYVGDHPHWLEYADLDLNY
jgi:hypothetical protein